MTGLKNKTTKNHFLMRWHDTNINTVNDRDKISRPGVRQVPEGSGEQGQMEETGCEIICGAPATVAVKGHLMMMMMM